MVSELRILNKALLESYLFLEGLKLAYSEDKNETVLGSLEQLKELIILLASTNNNLKNENKELQAKLKSLNYFMGVH